MFEQGKMPQILIICLLCLCVSAPAFGSEDAIKTYANDAISAEASVFPDGEPVYFTVSDGATKGGVKSAMVASGKESVAMPVYDDGTYPDKTAGDGVYTGYFRLSTIMTIDIPQDATRPHLVDCLYLKPGEKARITADLDADKNAGNKEVSLVTLFDVKVIARDTSAVITWTTSTPSEGHVFYRRINDEVGPGAGTEEEKISRILHRAVLRNLRPGENYFCNVSSKDVYGVEQCSDNVRFTTLTTAQLQENIAKARSKGDQPKKYFVSTEGDDANDGLSEKTPWRHIAYAVKQAQAGDEIIVAEGTYKDEAILFAASGLDVAPIKLIAPSDKAVLEGTDKKGICIKLKNVSNVEFAGLRITGYETGIKGEGLLKDLNLHDLKLDNLGGSALNFDGASLQNSRLHDFTISAAGLDKKAPAISHFSYSAAAEISRNVEVCDFALSDTGGAGVNWRNGVRIHFHHGTIKNTGGCALDYQLNVHCSVISEMTIENAGWHGAALHDHTVGKNPLYNNIIRNCRIYNAKHNEIDLHSGAFNTIVENCDLKGPLQAIYFHNLGAGLIARNNTIQNEHRGYWVGPIDGQFIMKAYFINNRISNDQRYCGAYSSGKGVLKDVAFIDNTFTKCTRDKGYYNLMVINAEDVLVKGNRFVDPVQPDDPRIYLKNCTGKIIVENITEPGTKVRVEGDKTVFIVAGLKVGKTYVVDAGGKTLAAVKADQAGKVELDTSQWSGARSNSR